MNSSRIDNGSQISDVLYKHASQYMRLKILLRIGISHTIQTQILLLFYYYNKYITKNRIEKKREN